MWTGKRMIDDAETERLETENRSAYQEKITHTLDKQS